MSSCSSQLLILQQCWREDRSRIANCHMARGHVFGDDGGGANDGATANGDRL